MTGNGFRVDGIGFDGPVPGGYAGRMALRRDLTLLFLAALLLRLAYVVEIRGSVAFSAPLVDARTYDLAARSIASGGLGALERPFYQPPLYPILLGGLYALAGGSYLAPRVVQAILGAVTVALVLSLAAGTARARGGTGRRAGWIAGGIAALYGPAIHLEGELLPPATLLALLTGALALLLRADAARGAAGAAGAGGAGAAGEGGDGAAGAGGAGAAGAGSTGAGRGRGEGGRSEPGRGRPVWPLLLAGLLLGLAGALRPSTLLLAAGAWVWWIRGEAPGRAHRGLASAALLAAAVALPILPFTIANLAAGDAALVSTNGGVNLYLGNGARSDSLTAIQPGYHWDRLQREPLRDGVSGNAAESAYWTRRAAREAAADPLAWLGAAGRKALRFLDAWETPRNTDYQDFRRDSWVLSLPLPGFGIVAPLALLGFALAFPAGRGPSRRRALFAIAIAAVAAENLLFFVAGRYRLEAVPVLCVLAGAGVDEVIRRRARVPAWTWVAFAALGAIVWIDLLGERRIDETRARIHRAVAYEQAGLFASAERVLTDALRADPDDVDANRLAGQAAARREDWNAARRLYGRAVDGAPDYVRALLGLATADERLGRDAEAEAAYRRAVEADPHDADARLGLGTFLAVRERWAEAREQFTIGLRIDPGHAALKANLRNLERLRGGSC